MTGRNIKERLAVVATHPVQYNAPWFRLLGSEGEMAMKVFYTWEQSQSAANFDHGFGRVVEWDIPLLGGYDYSFTRNISRDPGVHHFNGIVNPRLNREIQEWGATAILVFGWSYRGHLSCIRHFSGKLPILFRGDSTLLDERSGIKKRFRRLFLRWVYRHIDAALYTGTNNKAYFLVHGLKQDQLFFAPHAIDNDRFADPDGKFASQAQKWRADLGFSEQDLVVVFAGKLEQKKNPGIIARLIQRMPDPRTKFLLVGNGILERQLKEELKGNDRVRFMDFQNQSVMPVIYRIGDIFLLPSTGPGETWGLAINEAMASGRPVIASDKAGGAVDLIHPGENGYIFPPGDVEVLKNSILACADKSLRDTMGKRSAEIIRDWNFESIVQAVRSALNP